MLVAFKIPYVYDYITKLCRMPAEVILNHRNTIIRGIGVVEAVYRKYKRLKLGGGQAYDHQLTSSVSEWLNYSAYGIRRHLR
jgi:hypothetical protein